LGIYGISVLTTEVKIPFFDFPAAFVKATRQVAKVNVLSDILSKLIL
jgi:hypothetical protein